MIPPDQLDGDTLGLGLVLGLEHRAHAAGAQLAHQPESRDPVGKFLDARRAGGRPG